jgi:hypothetical protein
MTEQFKTSIEFTDDELKTLNDVLRATKVTFSSEEALMIKLGKASNPVLDLTFKVALIFEARANELNAPKPAEAPAEVD